LTIETRVRFGNHDKRLKARPSILRGNAGLSRGLEVAGFEKLKVEDTWVFTRQEE
jgi:hypothetical protein